MSSVVGILVLVGIGVIIGYLLFGRKKEKVYVQNTTPNIASSRTGTNVGVGYSRSSGSNMLETAAAVAGGVVAGELISDVVEDVMDSDIGNEIEDEISDAVDYVGESIEDAGEFVDDAIDDIGDIL